MKNKYLKFLIIILSSVAHFYAQDNPEAKLIDMHGNVNCEDILARTDYFFIELQKNPNAQGIIIIEVDDKNVRSGLDYEQVVKGQVGFRDYDNSRLKIVRSSSKAEGFKVTYWLVPPGAELPVFTEAEWDLSFPKNQKPFIFSQTDFLVCPSPEELGINLFADYLKANPKARGNIVIKTPIKKKFKSEKERLSKLISDKYKIFNKRLRFFHVKKQDYYDVEYPEIEIWILP